MTWRELAECQKAAARHLFAAKQWSFDRAVCGRPYYAAYALVTSCLPASVKFGRGWRNPEHAKLPGYIARIAGLSEIERTWARRAIRRLRQRREDADYRPGITVDRQVARESMRDLAQICLILQTE